MLCDDGPETSSVFGMVVHVLSRGDTFDLENREPQQPVRPR
jgi:hypothetical protein